MTDDKAKNKREFEDIEHTQTFAPIDDNADELTKTFDAVTDDSGEQAVYFDDAAGKSQIAIDGSGKEPLERCEERGAIKNYTIVSIVWRIIRPLLILAVSATLLFYLGSMAYDYIEESYFSPVDAQSVLIKNIEIKPGSSLSTISSVLFEEGIIRNKFIFQMYVDLKDMGSSLLAGKYTFSPGMTMDEIIKILGEGDGGRQIIKVTFTEGMTAQDIADTLVNKEILNEEEKETFLELCNDPEEFNDYNFIKSISRAADKDERIYLLEGYLFPDTYEIYADAQPEDIINKLLIRFDDIFTLDYEDRAKELGMSIDEVMTLASMIEWESLPIDFKKVSAVFQNRIEQEMQLGSCATLRYITGEKKFVYTAEERSLISPYNTYIVVGLPAGPVANPGKKAIEAALYPEEEFMEQGFLYFCNKEPESGELAFAKTLEEHQANVELYQDLW